MQQKYETEIVKREGTLSELHRKANTIGIFKVIWLVICAVTIYHIWVNQYPLNLIILACTEIIIFIAACFWHENVLRSADRESKLIAIAKDNVGRITGNWRTFSDKGEEFIDYNHNYSADLDIVGNHSLFQYLNSTNTYYGRQQFAQDLLNPEFLPKDIQERQEAISELSNDYACTSQIEYLLSRIGIDPAFPKLLSGLQSPTRFVENRFIRWMLHLSRCLTLAMLLCTLLTRNTTLYAITSILMAMQFFVWALGYSKINRYLGIMLKLPYKMEQYYNAVKEISDRDFHAEKLNQIHAVMCSAQEAMHRLSQIADHISQCQNGIVRMILNTLLLWDYKNAVDLDDWKEEYGASAESWFAALGELESLISFSNLPRNCNTASPPTLSGQPNYIRAENLGHPLLNNTQRVCNDLNLDNHILIISGSNMSGKTTFMRTVGLNIVLANAGSYVCADHMTFSPMKVITSMRIADELTEGISTFYAELKRIKKIIDAAKTSACQLFLIDEIFRGTNSVDRQKGAEEVIKKLCTLGISGMITTHDLEVCRLADSHRRIDNYSFNEHYIDGEICFDYKIKRGVSKTTNAEYLLRKVGII